MHSTDESSVSVIIVSWKVRDLLRECLRALLDQADDPPASMEVIVIDNDSQDGSVEMVQTEFPGVVVIASKENLGFGRGNNLGLEHAHGRFICLLNPDTVVINGAIGRCLRYLRDHPDIGIVGPRLLNTDGTLQRWTAGAFPNIANMTVHHLLLTHVLPQRLQPPALFLRDDISDTRDVGWVSGACMLLRREAFGAMLFDDRFFMYGEDMELCHRVVAARWRVVYYPSASIYHHLGGSMKRQTSTDVQAAALRGPRTFYAMIQPAPAACMCIDLLQVTGFLLRWVLYSAASLVSSEARFRAQAIACRRYLFIAIGLLFRRV